MALDIPGEARTVVNDKGERMKEGEGCKLYVGFSQPDSRSAELTGQSCKVLEL